MKPRHRSLLPLVILLVMGTAFVHAQTLEEERILVPIALKEPIRGAFGSEWHTEFVVRNDSAKEVRVWAGVDPFGLPFAIAVVPAHSTKVVPLFASGAAEGPDRVPAYIVIVHKPVADELSFHARVFDRSRSAANWGTEIPVVRESGAVRSRIQLVRIPTDPHFRLTLRVYGFDPTIPTDVLLRLFGEDENVPLGEQRVTLASFNDNSAGPQYWQTTDVAGTFGVNPGDRQFLRIEVIRLNERDLIWAFVSVTNNETQHVTTITPQ
jgi:hypothetical protein